MSTEKIPAVSVIIPMYNVEKYIGECLTSLLNQTLKNIEVIVVDDCSTDNSMAIVNKMIKKFSDSGNVLSTAKSNKNSGCPGMPRNFALSIAKGKYIYFCDSDDFVDETLLEDFYKVAEEFDADVVHAEKCFECTEVDGKFEDKNITLEPARKSVEKPTLDTFDTARRMGDIINKIHTTVVWNKFFRREFLIENDIKFPSITCTEDFIFSTMSFFCSKNYVRIPFIGYHYRKRPNSATSSEGNFGKSSMDLVEGIYFFDNFMRKQNHFIENPNQRYLLIDLFSKMFADSISKHMFFNQNMEPSKAYNFYNEIFAKNPAQNMPFMSYLFVSLNIFKVMAKKQAEEIEKLKKLKQETS